MTAASLEQLATALEQERSALLERDIQSLLTSSQRKRDALQALESVPPDQGDKRLAELMEANRFNGALLARRRHEIEVTLQHLRGDDSIPAYDAHGQHYRQAQSKRVLAVA